MNIERREQVFVSSTYTDLLEERQAVIQTLLQADCFPAGMEFFPASDDEKWDLIRRVIDDSDYYLVVVGGRYGSTDDEGLSYTEKEFDYAVQTGTPVMGFLHGAPGDIPQGKTDLDDKARDRLKKFREKVEERMCKFWTSPSDLAGAVALSLIQLRKTHPAEGWVRAQHAMTPESERELIELRDQVTSLQAALEEERVHGHAPTLTPDVFAHGEDEWEMPIAVRYYTKQDLEAGNTTPRDAEWYMGGRVRVTWDQIFAQLAPLLMDEASEAAMDSQLDEFAYIEAPEPPPLPEDAGAWDRVEAQSGVVHDVKVQLFSLGLIKNSEKRHPVTDTNAYWTLTPEGRDHMMRLRAIRRPEADMDSERQRDAEEPPPGGSDS